MSAKLISGQVIGLWGKLIDVEVDLSQGLFRYSIVGLPDKAVEESRERIASAIKNSGLEPPHKKNRRTTVNLAPASIKKEGPYFDLPIALGYLLASNQTSFEASEKMFIGELALDGTLRKAKGALALSIAAKKSGIKELYVPTGNGKEAAYIKGLKVYEVSSLGDILDHLEKRVLIPHIKSSEYKPVLKNLEYGFEDIKGQETAKRTAEISASGMHHMAMTGPPGTGKTLIARALGTIIPPLTFEEALEVTTIYSVAGLLNSNHYYDGLVTTRPFRSPHHTASYASLIGGGQIPRPGEITLAHRGILFLDELPEFDPKVIESIREPLEEGVITVSRVKQSFIFPARILLVAAMNLCPCGNRGTKRDCTCTPQNLSRYVRRLSGPIVDRIDLWVNVPGVEYEKLESDLKSESSDEIQKRTRLANEVQKERFKNTGLFSNSDIGVRKINLYCPLSPDSVNTLSNASRNLGLSARSYHKVIKISRTISDLDSSDEIKESHVLEALQYRPRLENLN